MTLHFTNNGWPLSKLLAGVPADKDGQKVIIDTVQDWKTEHYKVTCATRAAVLCRALFRLQS